MKRAMDEEDNNQNGGGNDVKKSKTTTAPSTSAQSSKHAGAADDVVIVPEDDDLIMVNWAASSLDRFLQNKTWHTYIRHWTIRAWEQLTNRISLWCWKTTIKQAKHKKGSFLHKVINVVVQRFICFGTSWEKRNKEENIMWHLSAQHSNIGRPSKRNHHHHWKDYHHQGRVLCLHQ